MTGLSGQKGPQKSSAFGNDRDGNRNSVEIAGIELPPSAVAALARCLSRAGHAELAMRIGLAVDTDQSALGLSPRERRRVVETLKDCPPALIPLRDGLAATA